MKYQYLSSKQQVCFLEAVFHDLAKQIDNAWSALLRSEILRKANIHTYSLKD